MRIGPVTFQTHVFLILAAALVGSLLVFFWYRGDRERRRLFFDRLMTAAFVVFLGWKIFPLFYSFREMVTHPLTLLYTPGGKPGLVFGFVLGLLYFGFKILRGKQKSSPEQRLLSPLLVFAVSFTGVSALLLVSSSVLKAEQGERPAASFAATAIQGQKISLKDLEGKTVILNFWATWCPPCRAEIPTLNAFHREIEGSQTVLVGIAVGSSQTPSTVKRFMKEEGINYPIILDASSELSSRYGVRTLPTTIVVSPGGTVTDTRAGAVDRYWLRSHGSTRR